MLVLFYNNVILFLLLISRCISLDLTGSFVFTALWIAKKAKGSGLKLFFFYFGLASIFSMLASNNIVILTLTPIIYYLTKITKLELVPYAILEFLASNIWSAGIYVGNPTNIIVAEGAF